MKRIAAGFLTAAIGVAALPLRSNAAESANRGYRMMHFYEGVTRVTARDSLQHIGINVTAIRLLENVTRGLPDEQDSLGAVAILVFPRTTHRLAISASVLTDGNTHFGIRRILRTPSRVVARVNNAGKMSLILDSSLIGEIAADFSRRLQEGAGSFSSQEIEAFHRRLITAFDGAKDSGTEDIVCSAEPNGC